MQHASRADSARMRKPMPFGSDTILFVDSSAFADCRMGFL